MFSTVLNLSLISRVNSFFLERGRMFYKKFEKHRFINGCWKMAMYIVVFILANKNTQVKKILLYYPLLKNAGIFVKILIAGKSSVRESITEICLGCSGLLKGCRKNNIDRFSVIFAPGTFAKMIRLTLNWKHYALRFIHDYCLFACLYPFKNGRNVFQKIFEWWMPC